VRRRLLTVLLVLTPIVVITAPPAGASPPAAGGVPCLPVVGCNPIGQLAGDGAKAAAAGAARASFDAFTSWVADGASALLSRVGDLIAKTTDVKLGAQPFLDQFDLMRRVGVLIVLPMLMAALIGAVIHRDPSRLARAVGLHLPLAVLGSFVAVELTTIGLQLTDQLSLMVSRNVGSNSDNLFGRVARGVGVLAALGKPDLGGFLALVAAVLVAAGALLIWVELLLRASAIYVAVLFLPVALAGLVWPATARWAKRLVELLAALILSKFVIVAVLSLAVGMVANSDGVDVALSGGALLLLAGFAPFVLLRLTPVVEAAAIGHLEGIERRPVARAAATGTQLMGMLAGHVEATGAARAATSTGEEGARIAANPTVGGELDRLPIVAAVNGSSADPRVSDDH
jgi:hypothetical protein